MSNRPTQLLLIAVLSVSVVACGGRADSGNDGSGGQAGSASQGSGGDAFGGGGGSAGAVGGQAGAAGAGAAGAPEWDPMLDCPPESDIPEADTACDKPGLSCWYSCAAILASCDATSLKWTREYGSSGCDPWP